MTSWEFWALLAAVFAALTAVLAKVGVESINPDFAMFIRTAVVLLALSVLLLATGKFESLQGVSRKSLVFLVLSGLATGASWWCYFRALKLGDATRVASLDKLSVVFVALIAAVFLGESLSMLNWLGIVLIAAGAALMFH
jgi:transporter family protein